MQIPSGWLVVIYNTTITKYCRWDSIWSIIISETGHTFPADGTLVVPITCDLGDWGSWETCPTGSYAAGFALKVRDYMSFTF